MLSAAKRVFLDDFEENLFLNGKSNMNFYIMNSRTPATQKPQTSSYLLWIVQEEANVKRLCASWAFNTPPVRPGAF